MARYRLYNKDGSPVTAEQLANFPIPALIPPAEVAKLVYPLYGPQAYEAKLRRGMTLDEITLYKRIWEDYRLAVIADGIANQKAGEDYARQFSDFAAVLESKFIFYTGTYNKPTRKWNWSLLPGVQYTMLQAAQRLIKYTGDRVAFILTGYFGW
jgi:hypothetical protein